MSLSDRERPRAFWVFAVLSRARPYHLFNLAYKGRPRAFRGVKLRMRREDLLVPMPETARLTE
ncbi:hypothetical protein, partial [Haloparvum sp. PAK95]|uniref:hypothetical protein n=1 Tax=Haloparvum sp. PAK95 TaxID=3418962 RepID=UPI003D2F10C5